MTVGTYTNPVGNFDSSLPDAVLGPEIEINHDRPPLGSFVFGPSYDGTVFILKDNLLYYCLPKQPEHWPSLYYLEVSPVQSPLQTGVFYNSQPYVFTTNEIYYIQGTASGTFFPLPMKAKTGAQSVVGAAAVDGEGIYHTGPDGVYLFKNGIDRKITEQQFEPVFRGNDTNGMNGMSSMSTSWIKRFKNRLYFGYQSSGDTYPVNVMAFNLETKQVEYYIYNDGSDVEISTIATDEVNNRLLLGDSTGYVRAAEVPSYTDDSGTAISWDIQSKDFGLQTRRQFPRWVKYDVDASSATSATGEMILDGASHQSHTITGNRVTKRRLVTTGNGRRAAIRISGSGPATVYAAESE